MQQKISLVELQHLSKLARLKLTSLEEQTYLPQIESVLEYMDILNETDTTSIEPLTQITGLKNITRNDEIKPSLDRSNALSSASKTTNGFVVVPNTIKK